MREAPLALHLTSFSGKPIAPAVLAAAPPAIELMTTLSVTDLDQRIAKAARDTEAALTAEFERKLLAAEEMHRAEHEAALAAARAAWVADEAQRLEANLNDGIATMKAALSDEIAKVLRHVMTDTLVAKALSLFGAAVDQLLGDSGKPSIVIRGPADLLAAFAAGRQSDPRVSFETAEGVELTIVADQVRIETCLATTMMSLTAEG